MADTTVTIPPGSALDDALERKALETGQTKADVALEALFAWMDEQDEIDEVLARLSNNEAVVSIDQVRRNLGLDD